MHSKGEPPKRAADAIATERADSRWLQLALRDWFRKAQRPLPWRDGYDPYKVWVSEMMLQQTQVETVKPYFARWMERLPDVRALATAPLEEVLKLWEGLGYYARARNLHRAAGEIVARHGGEIPRELAALRALPGIGPYSAGAIASIAFDQSVPLVDGNVARVLSRLYALDAVPQSPAGRRELWRLAESLVPHAGAREFNQALMELGALICRGQEPACGLCPLRPQCRAYALGRPRDFPVKRKRAERPVVRAVLLIAECRGRVLLRQRPPDGLWGGLWEFPWSGAGAGPAALRGLLRECGLGPGEARRLGTVQHGLSHRQYEWTCYGLPIPGTLPRVTAPWRWLRPVALGQLPLGRPMHKVIELWRAAAERAVRDAQPRTKRRRHGG